MTSSPLGGTGAGAATPQSPRGFTTRAVHSGQEPDPTTGSVIPPLYLTSTFVLNDVTTTKAGYDYTRSGHPNRAGLEATLADLEGGVRALVYSSGMAAEDALVRTLVRPGDHVLLPADVYGGTFRLLTTVFAEWGVDVSFVPVDDPAAVAAAIRPGVTTVLWAETPSNPLLRVADIAALAAVAHAADVLLVIDNTFASPYLQNPLRLGADVVVHSTTKYIGGHSDVVGGAVVMGSGATGDGLLLPRGRTGPTGTRLVTDAMAHLHNATGSGQAPFDAWLTSRGLKTLALRMDRHNANAAAVAEFLVSRPDVTEVIYPGLPSHPGHAIAARQMRGFGGMLSLRLGSAAVAQRLCTSTRIFALAVSLGGVESLIEYPAQMTHASAAGSTVAPPDDLVRLSIGVEDAPDLIDDLAAALDAAARM